MNDFFKHFGQESIVAVGRDKRPFISTEDLGCPFCPQNKESLECIINEAYDNKTLCARVIANKYPIASKQSKLGTHDVIIDTELHKQRAYDFSEKHWNILLNTIHKRWTELMVDASLQFIQVFKNDGIDAGASISHSHWQLLALEKVPEKMIQLYLKQEDSEHCYLCQLDWHNEGFLILENTYWRMWVPPMPEFMGEVWLVPKKHHSHFGTMQQEELHELGKLIKSILLAYEKMKPKVAYNICFMSGDLREKWHFHFYVRIVMRIGHIAGFEIATGCHILTLSPQDYAKELDLNIKGMYK